MTIQDRLQSTRTHKQNTPNMAHFAWELTPPCRGQPRILQTTFRDQHSRFHGPCIVGLFFPGPSGAWHMTANSPGAQPADHQHQSLRKRERPKKLIRTASRCLHIVVGKADEVEGTGWSLPCQHIHARAMESTRTIAG